MKTKKTSSDNAPSPKTGTKLGDGVYRRSGKGRVIPQPPPIDPFPLLPSDIQTIVEGSKLKAAVQEVDRDTETILFDLSAHKQLPGLPPGYFFKGGAAREHLRKALDEDISKVHARDFDLVRFAETGDEHDHRLSLKFMQDDYEFGRGVEVVENSEAYFQSRDLTVNEALSYNGLLHCSFRAIRDIHRRILRPTQHVTNAEGDVLSATIMKSIRFAAEGPAQGVFWKRTDFPENSTIQPFDIALNLERALSNDPSIAEDYLLLAWEAGFLLPSQKTPPPLIEAVAFLSSQIRQGIHLFRHLPPAVVQQLAKRA